jgi:hypothetical protein
LAFTLHTRRYSVQHPCRWSFITYCISALLASYAICGVLVHLGNLSAELCWFGLAVGSGTIGSIETITT